MKTSYDPATDSLYIHLADHASVDSVELTDGLVVDYDLDGVAVGIDMQRVSKTIGLKREGVQCSYLENEGTLHIRLTDKPVVRETSPNWHTNISYAEDGSIVEVVLLDLSTLEELKRQLVKAEGR
ncbi:MAG: DUF2283 domain-containing protein [Polaromonas sp.]